jgi:fatty acid synthase, animal type
MPHANAEDYNRRSKVVDYKQTMTGRLANTFNFSGPSMHFDTACASSFCAFHEAIVALRTGRCDRAIVVGLNLTLRSLVQYQFFKLNMISPDGHCKCLDKDANGYAKGEAFVVILLQKKSEAKRIYATVVHTKTNTDGYKDMGITFPSWELQRNLIQETYSEAGIDPLKVGFQNLKSCNLNVLKIFKLYNTIFNYRYILLRLIAPELKQVIQLR